MNWTLIALIIFAVLVVALIAVVKQLSKNTEVVDDVKYQKLDVIFTAAERSFFGVIKLAVNNKVEVFGKVRVADVITPTKGLPRGDWQRSFNKISRKHFDFLLCDKGDLSPICAIELDDKSHESKKRKERDQFLEAACKSAHLPLIQVPAKSAYQVTEIAELIAKHLPKTVISADFEIAANAENENATSDKSCPKCSSDMHIKVAKKGRNIGKEFWACSSFPKCRHIEPRSPMASQ